MNEQTVRKEIQTLIERKDVRIGELRTLNKAELSALNRLTNEVIIANLEHGIATLIELEHILHLCDCPDAAYATKGAWS